MRRTTTVVIALLASAVLLAGCGDKDDPAPTSPSTSTPSTTPTPSATPEEQAEAAAWKAYLKYEKTRSDLGRSPDIQKANRLAVQVAVPPESAYMVVGITQYAEKGQRVVGGDPVSTKTGANVRSLKEVVLDVCIDNSAVDVVDKSGKSVVLPNHPKKIRQTITTKRVDGRWYVAKADGGTEAC